MNKLLAHITLYLDDGSVADSTKVSGKPSWLIPGRGDFSPAFEAQISHLAEGDTHKFRLEAEDAFGAQNPDLVQFMDITRFPQDISLEEGAILAFDNPASGQMPGIIRRVMADSVKVDFNHPLAGQAITFEIEVLQTESVESSDSPEVHA